MPHLHSLEASEKYHEIVTNLKILSWQQQLEDNNQTWIGCNLSHDEPILKIFWKYMNSLDFKEEKNFKALKFVVLPWQ